eukprot:TRINITY_DN8195_c0_g1_i2.p1 TRINITY_DN8195_c0_g1~~TRINITY_DN8195_c0_g1_i2.p1  ORF type:complete len:380 (+),score=76.94 TRINITY_DN8195_c0_g1_i2:212-1351(+)
MGSNVVRQACCEEPAPYDNSTRSQNIRCLLGQGGAGQHAQFGRDGLVFVAGDEGVKMYDVGQELEVMSFEGHAAPVSCMDFMRQVWLAVQLVTGSADKSVRVWDIKTGEQLDMFSCQHEVTAVRSVPGVMFAATHNGDATCNHTNPDQCTHDLILMWRLRDSREVAYEFSGHTSRINGLEMIDPEGAEAGAPQDMLLLSYSDDGNGAIYRDVAALHRTCNLRLSVRIWNAADQVCLYNLHHPDPVGEVLVLEKHLVLVAAGAQLYLWDLTRCESPVFQRETGHHRITSCCVRRKEKGTYKFYTGDQSASVLTWKLDLDNSSHEKRGFRCKTDKLHMPKSGPESCGIVDMVLVDHNLFVAVDRVLEQWNWKERARLTQRY